MQKIIKRIKCIRSKRDMFLLYVIFWKNSLNSLLSFETIGSALILNKDFSKDKLK